MNVNTKLLNRQIHRNQSVTKRHLEADPGGNEVIIPENYDGKDISQVIFSEARKPLFPSTHVHKQYMTINDATAEHIVLNNRITNEVKTLNDTIDELDSTVNGRIPNEVKTLNDIIQHNKATTDLAIQHLTDKHDTELTEAKNT